MVRRVGRSVGVWRSFGLFSVIALLGLALLPAGASAASGKPVAWKATAGAQSRDEGIQVNAFLPHDMWVDVGDTITWSVPTGEFHTVTFLSGAAPQPLIVNGPNGPDLNPVDAAPAGGTTYAGRGFVNSGILNQGQSYTLGFSAPGDFGYVCLVHSEMKAAVHVQARGARYPKSQAQYDLQSQAERAGLLGVGIGLEGQGLAAALRGGRDSVTVGIGKLLPGTATLAVMRFEPGKRVVHVGDTVTWTNRDPETPHTVTFGTEPQGGPFAAFAPSGVGGTLDRPGHGTLGAPGQSVNSGFIGADLPFGTQFQVTFTAPGIYSYICALHDTLGMTGSIEVVR